MSDSTDVLRAQESGEGRDRPDGSSGELATRPSPEKPLWNSLEVTKIVVAVLTPLAILFFTLRTNDLQSEAASQRQRFAEVTKYRSQLWSNISPMMNDLYCYFLYVGHWKEISPQEVIETKRKLDKLVYSNSPFFSRGFLEKYNAFMSATFQLANGWGVDAKLQSPPIRDQDKGLEAMFAKGEKGGYVDNTTNIHRAYFDWLDFAAKEMDLEVQPPPRKPATPTEEDIRDRLVRKR